MPTDLFDLSGRVAIVTGASSGLGITFAEASSYITGQIILVDGGWTVW